MHTPPARTFTAIPQHTEPTQTQIATSFFFLSFFLSFFSSSFLFVFCFVLFVFVFCLFVLFRFVFVFNCLSVTLAQTKAKLFRKGLDLLVAYATTGKK